MKKLLNNKYISMRFVLQWSIFSIFVNIFFYVFWYGFKNVLKFLY